MFARVSTPRTAAFTLAFLIALAIAVDLLWMPVQVYDSVGEILDAQQSPSVVTSFVNSFETTVYLRPMRLAQIKALYELAGGEHYWLVYRGFHAVLAAAALLLFIAALRVSTTIDFAAAAAALAVLVGLHTFRGLVMEAFPINHFLEIVVFCLLTLNLSRSRGGWWADAAAAVTFGMAALTLESGLLVWVVAVTAWALGWRGISTRGIAALTLLAALYAVLRFAVLSIGSPDLTERSSGFLFDVLDTAELQERFGAQAAWFYIYNVATSALSVLFSEPRAGVFETTRAWLSGELLPRHIVALATSTATTWLLVWAAARRLRRPRAIDDTGRYIALFAVVLGANAVLSYAYTKDEIVSIAGTFYALAAFAVLRDMLQRPLSTTARVVAAAALVVLVAGWSVRAAGVHYVLRTQAFRHQNDWAGLPGLWRREGNWPADLAAQRLIWKLHDDAVRVEIPNTRIGVPRWTDGIWEE